MILASDDLVDWVADREALLVAAWTPQIEAALAWERPFAELLSAELHGAMLTTLLRKGTEKDFVRLIARTNTGIDPRTEREIADRFYNVTLKLARAASRHERESRTDVMPFKYGTVVWDDRTDPAHKPLAEVLLPPDHDFWTRWHPPFGMDCRCGTNGMTRGQFARSGRLVSTDVELAAVEAQLRDTWPVEFLPLLDFRRPLRLVEVPAPRIQLTSEQYAEISGMFDDKD